VVDELESPAETDLTELESLVAEGLEQDAAQRAAWLGALSARHARLARQVEEGMRRLDELGLSLRPRSRGGRR
jgi:hypothetical protein